MTPKISQNLGGKKKATHGRGRRGKDANCAGGIGSIIGHQNKVFFAKAVFHIHTNQPANGSSCCSSKLH